jgi:hypothetical protein
MGKAAGVAALALTALVRVAHSLGGGTTPVSWDVAHLVRETAVVTAVTFAALIRVADASSFAPAVTIASSERSYLGVTVRESAEGASVALASLEGKAHATALAAAAHVTTFASSSEVGERSSSAGIWLAGVVGEFAGSTVIALTSLECVADAAGGTRSSVAATATANAEVGKGVSSAICVCSMTELASISILTLTILLKSIARTTSTSAAAAAATAAAAAATARRLMEKSARLSTFTLASLKRKAKCHIPLSVQPVTTCVDEPQRKTATAEKKSEQ